jgi:hypothetical protein
LFDYLSYCLGQAGQLALQHIDFTAESHKNIQAGQFWMHMKSCWRITSRRLDLNAFLVGPGNLWEVHLHRSDGRLMTVL